MNSILSRNEFPIPLQATVKMEYTHVGFFFGGFFLFWGGEDFVRYAVISRYNVGLIEGPSLTSRFHAIVMLEEFQGVFVTWKRQPPGRLYRCSDSGFVFLDQDKWIISFASAGVFRRWRNLLPLIYRSIFCQETILFKIYSSRNLFVMTIDTLFCHETSFFCVKKVFSFR